MATLYVAEFATLVTDIAGVGQIAQTPPTAEQAIAIGGASVPSTAFANDTQFIRLHADAICSVAFGTAPVATATTMRLAAGQTEYFGVNPAGKIAVITNT